MNRRDFLKGLGITGALLALGVRVKAAAREIVRGVGHGSPAMLDNVGMVAPVWNPGRTIYVCADPHWGNDRNDGLSPETAVRSYERMFEIVSKGDAPSYDMVVSPGGSFEIDAL